MCLLRSRWLWVAGGALVLGGIVAGVRLASHDPGVVRQLERAGRAGETTQSRSQQLVDDLQQIAENLSHGRGLPEQSEEIHQLTVRQQRSLEQLAGILRDQLRSLRHTRRSLQETETAVTGVTELGERQRELLARALDALHRLRGFAHDASAMSAAFAQKALYGARLAEDSQRSFSGP